MYEHITHMQIDLTDKLKFPTRAPNSDRMYGKFLRTERNEDDADIFKTMVVYAVLLIVECQYLLQNHFSISPNIKIIFQTELEEWTVVKLM